MPVEIIRQTNFNGGELDPRMRGRRDTKIFYTMLELGQNLVTTPAGTLEQRPGLTFVDYVRRQLQAVNVTAAMCTAPVGGAVSALVAEDGSIFETTTDLGADPQVLWQVDFGAPARVGAVDLVDYAVKETGGGAATPEPPPFQYPQPTPIFDFPIVIEGGMLP